MSEIYSNSYLLVSIFLFLGLILPVGALTVGRFLRPHNPVPEKLATYESGMVPVGSGWVQFNVQYYMYCLLFVVFDVETIFLYPWAVAYRELGLFALIEMLIFITLLGIGLIYAWKKKVLEWQ